MDQPRQVKPDVPRRIGVREFRGNMSAVLRQAKQGRSFIITCNDEVVAELNPPSKPDHPRRLPGALRGSIIMAPDFDTLPDSILAAMEGGST